MLWIRAVPAALFGGQADELTWVPLKTCSEPPKGGFSLWRFEVL